MARSKDKRLKPLLPKQELFCHLYLRGDKTTFGNQTRSYIQAYEVNLDIRNKDGTPDNESIRKLMNICRVSGHKLVINVNVKKRMNEMLKETFNDSDIDNELSKIITQNNDLSTKLSGIKEYNRLKERVLDKNPIQFTYDLTGKTPKELQEIKNKLLTNS